MSDSGTDKEIERLRRMVQATVTANQDGPNKERQLQMVTSLSMIAAILESNQEDRMYALAAAMGAVAAGLARGDESATVTALHAALEVGHAWAMAIARDIRASK